MRVLVVDEGLRALCRQQRANLLCVNMRGIFARPREATRGLAKMPPRHSFPAPCFEFLWHRKFSSGLAAVSLRWFLLTLAILCVIIFHRPISIFLLLFGLLGASLQ
jgi:hypothetical protein